MDLFDQVVFYWTLVARHISRCIDKNPTLKPDTLPTVKSTTQSQIALSSTQESQIREIFELFDTDGGGTIDCYEIDFAMVALGFQSGRMKTGRSHRHHVTANILDTITADGHVTLEEFVKLMTGYEAGGSDPMRAVATAFAVLSRSRRGGGSDDNLITFDKLQTVCRDFEVIQFLFISCSLFIVSPSCSSLHSLLFLQPIQTYFSLADAVLTSCNWSSG